MSSFDANGKRFCFALLELQKLKALELEKLKKVGTKRKRVKTSDNSVVNNMIDYMVLRHGLSCLSRGLIVQNVKRMRE